MGGYAVKRFVEKPSYETALEYVDSGRYLWNSGMFCFKAGTVLEQFKLHAPAIYQHALTCWDATLKSIRLERMRVLSIWSLRKK